MNRVVFKGKVHKLEWLKFVLITALVVVTFLKVDFDAKGSFIVVPLLLGWSLISKYRAKLIIENGVVRIEQFENRHEILVSEIRRIEELKYSGLKKLIMPNTGIHIFYKTVSDAAFFPADPEGLKRAIEEARVEQALRD
ncbi:MAG: hypothetical protein N4A46_00805 [Schleiferiaceae bacterium]|jgi:hypothetical protein|nr:hypothetical protein [Schleiferiaceae bacterium]